MIEHGLLVAGAVVPGTDLVRRHPDAGWDWARHLDRPDLRKRPSGKDTTLLVGHWSGGPIRIGDDVAPLTVAAMRARKRPDGTLMDVSAHFVIGWDGQVWQLADLALATVHVGGGLNPRSIGVETAWPGTAKQADSIVAALTRRGKPVPEGYRQPRERRLVRRRPLVCLVCLKPSKALLSGWVRLAELLAALPASTGIVIPRQLAKAPGWRGVCEHQHAPKATKVDAAGYLVDALEAVGWGR